MKNMYRLGFLLVLTGALLLAGCAKNTETLEESRAQEESESRAENSQEQEEHKEAADGEEVSFEGVDLEGNLVSSSVFSQSKLTMINVWATYCNPCLREMPALGELEKEYDSEEFQILGVISDVEEKADQETRDYAAYLIEETGADYTHLVLNQSLYEALLTDVTAVPTTFFLDENGVVLDTVIGAMEKSDWEEKIDALLEEQ